MSKVAKRYSIDQSPLYMLRGIGQLERALNVEVKHLDRLLSRDNFRVWKNERGREIQQPIKWLGQIHGHLGKFLSRIVIPDYVFSKRGHSSTENARHHLGNVPLGKTDIHKFYPSTTRQMVWQMFVREFRCAEDVAHILADVCCYEQEHLPTGSPISGYVSYLASKRMFDEIFELASANGCRMSVYVDDVTLSGSIVNKRFIVEVRRLVRKHGLKTKASKTKTFPADGPKTVTGAVIVGRELRVPNIRLKKIWETRQALKTAAGEKKKELLNSLRGRLQQARQIHGTTKI